MNDERKHPIDAPGEPSQRGVAPPSKRFLSWSHGLFWRLAVQDWVALIYFAINLLVLLATPASDARSHNLLVVGGVTAWLAATLISCRGMLFGQGLTAALVYRVGILGVPVSSYLMLQDLLPVVNTGSLDQELYQLDLTLFGVEPAVWMDRFVTTSTTEWFSFFYYSYFFLIAGYSLSLLFGAKDMLRFARFSLGFITLYMTAHLVYMLVPGYGPYKHLADLFTNPLPQGFWYNRVIELVSSAGAQKDIFPSLHTGAPSFCFFFAWRNRNAMPYKYLWLPTGFFAANIIIATMFLRWHYVIDVVVGFSLAFTVERLTAWVASWEQRRREQLKLPPVWTRLGRNPEESSP